MKELTEKQDFVKFALCKYIEQIKDPLLKKTIVTIFEDFPDFFWGKGAREKHHAYEGGLAAHTLEVMDCAINMACATHIGIVNRDWIIASVLIHDIGKLFDYKRHNDEQLPEYSFHGNHIRHLVKSYAIWYRYAMHNGVNVVDMENIEHILLAHHGRAEWGSPTEPKTVEAMIVHYADMLSSRFGAFKNE